ncbi:uncharacterized protein LOC108678766 [Hyalella azteca]|uniref:Uncharacterized protein LOC108678766 n=1 Tax=Hyalella azteca TaxID=294128 RepID=A0A8B7P9I6_HYAAZ|nr:uncharacterized protein LOC108678766 [Hyalella azteca]
MSLPEVKNPPLVQRLFCRTMPMEPMNYSNPVPPCPGQEPMDFKNPSPPTLEMQFSPSNVTKKKSDKISSPLQLFNIENRFSRMKIKVDSLVQGDNFHGFAKFMRANEHNMLSCWEEQNAVVDTPSTQIKVENDGCLDPHASHRCRRFLKGKKCQDKCTKLHRLPKEDGIKCLSEQYKQCHLGKKCIFVHENDSDTDSEPDSSSTLNLPPNNIAAPSCSSNPVKSEVGVKRKEVNDVELPCNKKIKQEKDCLPPSSLPEVAIKSEPAEVDIYKHEAIDYPVKQEEKISTDTADTSSLLQERVTNDLIISVPDGYQSVSEELLSQVSTIVLNK